MITNLFGLNVNVFFKSSFANLAEIQHSRVASELIEVLLISGRTKTETYHKERGREKGGVRGERREREGGENT